MNLTEWFDIKLQKTENQMVYSHEILNYKQTSYFLKSMRLYYKYWFIIKTFYNNITKNIKCYVICVNTY